MMGETVKAFILKRKQQQLGQQFRQVLKLILYCYKKILEEETFDFTDISKVKNIKPEDYLKYNLTQKYLRQYKEEFPGTDHLLFLYEVGEYHEDTGKESVKDIAVFNVTKGFSGSLRGQNGELRDEDCYFSFECKRLKSNSKNRLYIAEGIKRYVENTYARAVPIAGMIGFVEAGDIIKIKDDINLRLKKLNESAELKTNRLLTFFQITDDFDYSFSSNHDRVNNTPIGIHHLFLDYSPIIIS
jgi:hypothetical protein